MSSMFDAILITGGLPVRTPTMVSKGSSVTREVYVTYGASYNEAPTFFIGEDQGDVGVVRVSSCVWNDFEEANHALYHGCYSYVFIYKGEEHHSKPVFSCNDDNF